MSTPGFRADLLVVYIACGVVSVGIVAYFAAWLLFQRRRVSPLSQKDYFGSTVTDIPSTADRPLKPAESKHPPLSRWFPLSWRRKRSRRHKPNDVESTELDTVGTMRVYLDVHTHSHGLEANGPARQMTGLDGASIRELPAAFVRKR